MRLRDDARPVPMAARVAVARRPGAGPRVTLLGVGIDALTMAGAVGAFQRLIARRQPALAIAVNVDVCMQARKDAELLAVLHAADLVMVDGTPMMWAARFLGTPLPERISGSDFVPIFCGVAAAEGYRIFLLGAAPGVADGAARALVGRYPALKIAGTYAPRSGFERDDAEGARIAEVVRRVRTDVLFAAFGAPKQEKWLSRFRDRLGVPVSMGVGSTFDYLAGRLKRAPSWMQLAGLEWTCRLAQEPRRLWSRYLLQDSPFAYHVVRQRLRKDAAAEPREEASSTAELRRKVSARD